MSEISMTQCDGCDKITANHYATKFWIHISGITSISQAKGFYGTSSYQTWFKQFPQKGADFCNWKCFKKFVKKEDKK